MVAKPHKAAKEFLVATTSTANPGRQMVAHGPPGVEALMPPSLQSTATDIEVAAPATASLANGEPPRMRFFTISLVKK
jgi:hypothetical protein